MRGLLLGFGVGVGVGAGGCYLYLAATRKSEHVATGDQAMHGHPTLRFGIPKTDIVRVYEGYVTAYDYRTRNPKWVLEHVTRDSWGGEGSRDKSEFFEDPGVDPRFRAKLSDYRNSGYDRGHMAPAANHRTTQKQLDETFSLSNISPQVGMGFNRDYWARFERFVKEVTRVAGDVYIITGPLYLPTTGIDGKWALKHDLIGQPPGLVSVPTHFYKVVLADCRNSGGPHEAKSGRDLVGVGAFVMPNQPIDKRMPLSAFVVPLEDLEAVAGTHFFPEFLGDAKRRRALDTAAAGWRHAGLAQLKPFERVTLLQAQTALPAPKTIDVEAVPASGGASSSSSGTQAQRPPPPKTTGGQGAVHLCELTACKLPHPDFYLNAPQGGPGHGGSSTSSHTRR